MKATFVAFVALVSLVGTELPAQNPANQTASGITYARPAGGLNCTDDRPRETGGCAAITTIRVHLSLDANITKIRLRSAGPGRDQMHDNNPGDNIEWATWLPPVQGTTPTNKYVDAKFKNWSHNQQRKVEVIVEWTARR